MTTIFDPNVAPPKQRNRRHPVSVRRAPSANPALGKLAVWATLAGLLVVVVLGIATETRSELALPGGLTTFVGSLTGLVGMYLALVMVLIIARIPPLERIIGQDGMLRWHRRLAPWPISLIVAHAIFITIGYAQASRTGALHELWALVDTYPDMLAATVGLSIMVAISVVSIRAIRNRLRRETWWVIHLYMYLALALSFAHVIVLGPAFVGHPMTRVVWSLVWAVTAGTVLTFRFVLPVVRSLRHGLRVVAIHREAPDVVSVVLAGRHVDRLAVSGGQFFAWRFLTRGMWWQAHPYSLSALPRPPYLRLTVKEVGDHSAAVARIRRGTRVAIEGPYGAITADARVNEKVALVAGGIGITALRSLIEDLPRGSNPAVVRRASSEEDLVFRDEVAELVRQRKGTLHELVGSRTQTRMTSRRLAHLIPDIAARDLFVCGPPGMVEDVVAAATALGVPQRAIHHEIFSW
ncbi:MAG: ferredoxin reductase family protein [Acidimicrobiales bacterium]